MKPYRYYMPLMICLFTANIGLLVSGSAGRGLMVEYAKAEAEEPVDNKSIIIIIIISTIVIITVIVITFIVITFIVIIYIIIIITI